VVQPAENWRRHNTTNSLDGSRICETPFHAARNCYNHSILDVSGYGDDMPLPSFGPRLRCERCGHLGVDARPNWQGGHGNGLVLGGGVFYRVAVPGLA
jgi:hypothetical protein